jgi:Uma2 family endonuclease
MQEYMENGAQLGWLIDPETRSVTIYRTNEQPETLTNIDSLTATEPLTNFILDLAEVWNPLQ